MDLTLFISFIGTVLILVCTPGPSVLLATANSMKYGAKKTSGTILGDLSANLLQIIVASAGLATIVISSGELFQIIKWLGVAYLIFIGVKKIITIPKTELKKSDLKNRSFFNLYTEGFLMSAANPKAIVFFASLFPLFINETLPFIPQVIILGITFLILDGISLLTYVHFATKLKSYLENKEKVHLQNKIVGSLLILSGLMLSMVKRTNN
ncbi:LysE family translocator [Maribacter sp. ACAM166]|uniref:LysE family translocator n=1 Tax=Maribacter sp. ACAM166 TaxID=2508996 RepID=UPI0010FF382D|nr:LysE family translocator [Maribacter sp. ACAM166]TLP74245.1 LysE family translocator [Maribacter sp. ACAM166]